MKTNKLFFILAAFVLSLPTFAQTTEKEYIDKTGSPIIANVYPTDIPYPWLGKYYSESGSYIDTLKNPDFAIADTIFKLQLTIKTYVSKPQQTVYLAPGTITYSWRGKDWPVVDGMVYTDIEKVSSPFTSSDTIYSLHMVVKQYYFKATQSEKVCQTQLPYIWRGKEFTVSGLYRDTFITSSPKDTIYSLQLAVGAPFERVITYNICPGESVTYRGKTYTSETIDTTRFITATGCDSIYILKVHVSANSLTDLNEQICEGDTYRWFKKSIDREVILTQQGVYYDSLKNTNGCDSIIRLHLTVHKPKIYKDSVSICEHDAPYKWRNKTLHETGVYYDTVANATLCDSIFRLALTVSKDKHTDVNITFCSEEGMSHRGGPRFFTDQVFIDTLPAAYSGCDSIVKTVYQAGHRYFYHEDKHRSQDSVNFVWRGQVYTKDGVYTQTHPGSIACDSTWELRLMTDYSIGVNIPFCEGNTVYHRGQLITRDTIIIDSLHTTFGGDSVITTKYVMHTRFVHHQDFTLCANEPMPWPGHEHILLSSTQEYQDAYTDIYGCDSIYYAHVTTNIPIIKDTFISISRYHEADSLPYIWTDKDGHLHSFNSNIDTTEVYQKTASGCDSVIFTLYLRIVEKEHCSFDTFFLCPNGMIAIDGRYYTEPGDYENWIMRSPESTYKDSIHYFHIDSVRPSIDTVFETVTICQNKTPYYWNTRTCSTTGIYYDTITSSKGCDSIVGLNLTVNPTHVTPYPLNVCPGNLADYKGKQFAPGTYYDTLTSSCGCDSILQVIVNEQPKHYYTSTVYLKQGDSYTWHGHHGDIIYSEPGIYWDSCTTQYGCDSVYRLELKPKHTYIFKDQATICQNEVPYVWREKFRLYESGVFYDSLTTKQNEDSIYEFTLTVLPIYNKDSIVNACEGSTITIHGHVITDNYVFNDSLSTIQGGCDSIITYHVVFHKSEQEDLVVHLGASGEYYWHGDTLTEPGIYSKTISSVLYGCDSLVYNLQLIGDSSYHFHEYATICEGERYTWHGQDYIHSGNHNWKTQSIYGKDSIETLHLTVNPVAYDTTVVNLCQGQSYEFRGKTITAQGLYNDTLPTIKGCDSITTAVVRVFPNYNNPSEVILINGDSLEWQDTTITTPGLYKKHFTTTVCGCDSDYVINVIVADSFSMTESLIVCQEDMPYQWQGKTLNEAGFYTQRYTTQLGADSIYHLHLTVAPKFDTIWNASLCPGDKIQFFGQTITAPGVYHDTIMTAFGCDSTFTLYVNPIVPTILHDTTRLCEGQRYEADGYTFTERGEHTYTTKVPNSCDSIQHHVIISPIYLFNEAKTINQGNTFIWTGHKGDIALSVAGTYYDSLTSIYGCDSIYKLQLTVHPVYSFEQTTTICSNERYLWHGQEYNQTGDYQWNGLSVFGTDSIEILHLKVNPAKWDTTIVNLCQGQNYDFRGKSISAQGFYNDTLHTTKGCDSITTAVVRVFPNYNNPSEVILINGDSLEWQDTTITTPGLYKKHYTTTVCGCDSDYVINVIVADSFSMTESLIVCQEDMPYQWQGKTLNEAGFYTQRYTTQLGADSIYHLHLTVAPKFDTIWNASLCPGGKIYFFHQTITTPGVYHDTLLSKYGCDSTFTLYVNQADQKFSYDTIRGCYGEIIPVMDTTFTTSGEYEYTTKTGNGCDSIIHFTVQIEPKHFYEQFNSFNQGSSYIWVGHKNNITLSKAGLYYDSLTTVNGCDSIFKLTLTMNKKYFFIDSTTICKNEAPYEWRGKLFDRTGLYYDSLLTEAGMDSVYCLKLTVNPAIIVDEEYHACEGDIIYLFGQKFTSSTIHYDTTYSLTCPQVTRTAINFYRTYFVQQSYQLSMGEQYLFIDTVITTPGVYLHKGVTRHGCDSLVELTVTACKDQAINLVNILLCTGDTLAVGDTLITKGCKFTRTYVSEYGCDSTVQYNVQENATYHYVKNDVFCANSTYQWLGHFNDTIFTKEGRYDEVFKTVNGCDSVYTLFLTALPTYIHDTTIFRCQDEIPYTYKGVEYFIDKDFVDTFHTASRCDSICITRYRINQHCSPLDIYTRCEGDLLIIDDQYIIEDGDYRIPRDNDSIHRFRVLSYPVYEFSTNLGTHCDSITYMGTTYFAHTTGDTIRTTLNWKSIHGCDSIEHLSMVLYRSAPTIEHSQIIYDYASVLMGGQLYSKTGDYIRNYRTIHGCDSTYILHLTVIPTDSTGAMHYQFCSQATESLEIFGKLYRPTKDTIIFDTTAIPNVHMSIIKKAIVRVVYPFTISSLKTESEICAQPILPITFSFKINGSYPEWYELDFLPGQLLALPSHHEGYLNGRNSFEIEITGSGLCVNPGEYKYRLKLTNEGCHKSDTTIYSSFTVYYPSSIMEAYWTNTVALVNQANNDGHWALQPPYNWQIIDASGYNKTEKINPNQNLSYLTSDLLSAGDRITVTPLRDGYAYPVPSCEFTFYPTPTTGKVPVLVTPTSVAKRGMVQIQAPDQGTYQLYNPTGNKCQQGRIIDGVSSFEVPGVTGFYLLQIDLQDGTTTTERLIVF